MKDTANAEWPARTKTDHYYYYVATITMGREEGVIRRFGTMLRYAGNQFYIWPTSFVDKQLASINYYSIPLRERLKA